MKRLMALCLLLIAPAALGFDTARSAARVGVLRPDERFELADQARIADLVHRYLRDELRRRGLDAIDAGVTFEEAARGAGPGADYFIELGSGDSDSVPWGGAGIGDANVEVSVAVIASRVSGELRLYDGETLELISSDRLLRRNTAVMPVSVGVGSRSFFAVLAVPLVNRLQYRSAARAVARDAADLVVEALRTGM